MTRSVWKGPFVEESLIKKAEKQKNEWNQNKPEIIIFNLMHSDVFNIQVRAFSDENQGEHSFKYINSKILDEIIKGNSLIHMFDDVNFVSEFNLKGALEPIKTMKECFNSNKFYAKIIH